MAKIKLTKSAVEAAQPQAQSFELRDTLIPGFLCKVTPVGRRVFMLQYRTNAGERRKPALGQFGELTVEQARMVAQDWLAEVRRGGEASVYPREVVKAALMVNATAMVVAHNHPSRHPEPSEADRALTERLKWALALVDIRLLDHIVVGGTETVSFAERGLL